MRSKNEETMVLGAWATSRDGPIGTASTGEETRMTAKIGRQHRGPNGASLEKTRRACVYRTLAGIPHLVGLRMGPDGAHRRTGDGTLRHRGPLAELRQTRKMGPRSTWTCASGRRNRFGWTETGTWVQRMGIWRVTRTSTRSLNTKISVLLSRRSSRHAQW